MSRIWRTVFGAVLGATLLAAVAAQAQDYPSKPIKILVPTAPGGIADQIARIVAQHLTDSAKQTVVVENRTGGGGAIAAEAAAKSPADGYTILLGLHATKPKPMAPLDHLVGELIDLGPRGRRGVVDGECHQNARERVPIGIV